MTQYIGVIDHNHWEGEDFGFYLEDTEENRSKLRTLKENIEQLNDEVTAGGTDVQWIFDSVAEEALDHLAKTDQNGYMSRVNKITHVYADFDPDAWSQHPVYKGGCFETVQWSRR